MEKFQELQQKAQQKLKLAEQMLNVTYPLANDSKLLVNLTEQIFLAMNHMMASLLHHERIFQRIPNIPDNFEGKISVFKKSCMERYNISQETIQTLEELRNIILKHQNSPVEFRRRDHYVICEENYHTIIISVKQIKDYLEKSKLFIEEATPIFRNI